MKCSIVNKNKIRTFRGWKRSKNTKCWASWKLYWFLWKRCISLHIVFHLYLIYYIMYVIYYILYMYIWYIMIFLFLRIIYNLYLHILYFSSWVLFEYFRMFTRLKSGSFRWNLHIRIVIWKWFEVVSSFVEVNKTTQHARM